MALTTQNETLHAWGFVVSELEKTGSRDKGTLVSGQASLKAGTVLGKITAAVTAPVYTADGGNTGNFTSSAVAESAGAVPGNYRMVLTAATKFDVFNPSGDLIGEGVMGTAFSGGGIGFTITAGATPGVVGDAATIAVSAGSNKYAINDPAATDGSQNAVAILGIDADATSADVTIPILNLSAEVNAAELVWKAGMTTNQKNASLAQLATLGIKAR